MMRTLPAYYLGLVEPALSPQEVNEALTKAVKFGDRVELNLSQVRESNASLADLLEAYHVKTSDFWDRYVISGEGGPCKAIERLIITYNKVDNKAGKIYLKEQINALSEVNGYCELISSLLNGRYDEEMIALSDATVTKDGTIIDVEFYVPGKSSWPASLGGEPGRGEIGRKFMLKISHAKSHDRKNQRLLELKVLAREIWPK